VRAFLRRLGEEDAVVGEDGDRVAVQMGEAADQGGAEQRLEFIELVCSWPSLRQLRLATQRRAMESACSSFSA